MTVSFECADSTSGIASCPAPVIVNTEGANQVVTGTAVDHAGNEATASVSLSIDKTPPGLASLIDPASNSSNWHNTDVTVSFEATDALSGVETVTPPVTVTTEGANQLVNGTARTGLGIPPQRPSW